MSGWIKLDRELTNNFLWSEKPFSKAQAWVDLLLMANHAPAKLMIKSRLVSLERGDQARSEVTLSATWGWSRDKVRRFLKLLEREGMIRQQKNNLTSVVTICNYNKFQGSPTADDTADKTAGDTPTIQQTNTEQDTNKKNNNNKNEKKDITPAKPKRFLPPTKDNVFEYMFSKGVEQGKANTESERFTDYYESNGWKVGKNKMKSWQASVRNWIKGFKNETRQRPNQPAIDHNSTDWGDDIFGGGSSTGEEGRRASQESYERLVQPITSSLPRLEASVQQPSGIRSDQSGMAQELPSKWNQ